MHRVDRAARGVGGHHREQRTRGDAEADLLAFHVAASDAELMQDGVAGGLLRVADRDARQEQHDHRRQDRPALARVIHRTAEQPGEPEADQEDRQHLHHVGPIARVLERVGGIGVKEAAAVGAEHLDRFLGGDRPQRDRLTRAFQRRGGDLLRQRLRYATRDQHQRVDDRDRQQQVERDPRQVGPEVADRRLLAPREAAEQRKRERDADRGREEVVDDERQHLAEIAHHSLARIPLPVGIGGEADRDVERAVRADAGEPGSIERQVVLDAQQQVGQQQRGDAEQEHVHRIAAPRLLLRRVDPG